MLGGKSKGSREIDAHDMHVKELCSARVFPPRTNALETMAST